MFKFKLLFVLALLPTVSFGMMKRMPMLVARASKVKLMPKVQMRQFSNFGNKNTQLPKLVNAVAKSDIQKVQSLLVKGANPDEQCDKLGITSLMVAAGIGNVELVKILLNSGAKVDTQSNDGGTALMLAANYGKTEVAQILLKSGANPNAQSSDGVTPLMLAALENQLDVAKLLLNNGALPNIVNHYGHTALIKAAAKGNQVFAKLLMEHGAKLEIKDNAGMKAEDYIAQYKLKEKLLLSGSLLTVFGSVLYLLKALF